MFPHRRYAMPLTAMVVCWAIPALAQEPWPEDAPLAGIEAVQSATLEADAPAAPATEERSPAPAAPVTEGSDQKPAAPGTEQDSPPPVVPAADGSDPPPTAPGTERSSPPAAAPATEPGNPPPADSAPPGADVTAALFVIDDILVEGAKHGSARVVVAETLLTVGQSYSEAELQQALHRVERLPFVVKAEFGLRKGSERGHFLLVVTISETWPVFAGAEVTKSIRSSAWGLPEVGARVFLRGYNEFSVAYRGSAEFGRQTSISIDPNVDASFTRHNLFSKRLAGTGRFEYASERGDVGGYPVASWKSSSWEATGKLAFAATRASVLEVDYSERWRSRQYSYGEPGSLDATGPFDERSGGRSGTLGWRFDSTDDPFVPRGGSRLTLSVAYSQSDYESQSPEGGRSRRRYLRGAGEGHSGRISAGGTRIWPLKGGMSLMGKAMFEALDYHFDGRHIVYEEHLPRGLYAQPKERDGTEESPWVKGSLEVGLLGTLLTRTASSNHFWWEIAAFSDFISDEKEVQAGDFATSYHSRSVHGTVRLSVAARGRWGAARLSFEWWHDLWRKYEAQ